MLQEFRKFLMRGNVVELAVGLIMALAFSKIVTSLVNDIVMPPIGLLLGRVDFTSLYVNLSGKEYASLAAAKAAGAATINYGIFINTIVEFLIVGFVLFMVVRQLDRVTARLGLERGGGGESADDVKDAVKDQLKESSSEREKVAASPGESGTERRD
jgi:large conductance mechanosensitive channel